MNDGFGGGAAMDGVGKGSPAVVVISNGFEEGAITGG